MGELLSAAEVLKQCNKEVSAKEAEVLVEKNNSVSVNAKCKQNRDATGDLKKMIATVSTIKVSEDATNRIDKLDNAINALKDKTKLLRRSMNSSLFSTEVDLLDICGMATKEAIFTMNGTVSIDPTETANRIRNSIEIMRNSYKNRKEVIGGEDINELLVDEVDENDPDENCDNEEALFEFFEDNEIQESNRFAANLGFLDQHYGFIQKWSSGNRKDLYGEREKEVNATIQPAVWENTNTIEFMISLVNIAKIEKQKKTREKPIKDPKEKAELVKLTDKKDSIKSQSEEVSIMKELQHVHKSLKNVLRKRKADSIPYYEFILNPTDFARTVENMFYVSYLVRDGVCYLVNDGDVPYLKCAKMMPDEAVNKLKETSTFQGVGQLNFKQWKELCETFTEACIESKTI